ncbi:alpha-defensin 24-like [Arvicanthis niloticus]|uniref:alpha-defensin 24-like n=1 Tax=Arvicanthis niloticus TaxID=61156 RepID=UPI00402BEE96
MKTLVLLSALVLLALQVQADPIQETNEETKTDEQPGEEDQDMSVSFEVPEVSALSRNGNQYCHCRHRFCRGRERLIGRCAIRDYVLCCHH